jgi:hypothetical protein
MEIRKKNRFMEKRRRMNAETLNAHGKTNLSNNQNIDHCRLVALP